MEADHTFIRLQEDPLSVAEVDAFLRDERAGGICIFTGTTRRWTGEDETVLLEYESYETMARNTMEELAAEAFRRWKPARVALVHRIGTVPVAEASVVVGVSAAHRAEAFEACRWLIDTLKQDVPIWKRERYQDGREGWVEGPVPDPPSDT